MSEENKRPEEPAEETAQQEPSGRSSPLRRPPRTSPPPTRRKRLQGQKEKGKDLHADPGADGAAELAAKLAEEEGLTYIHPFNDLEVATGQAPSPMRSSRTCRRGHHPGAHRQRRAGGGCVHPGQAAQPQRKSHRRGAGGGGLHEGQPGGGPCGLPAHRHTIADGTAVKTPGDKVFPYIRDHVDRSSPSQIRSWWRLSWM